MDEKIKSFMIDWTVNFIKNKDIVTKKIESIQNNKDNFDIYVKYKDREQYFIMAPALSDIQSIISSVNNQYYFTIVTLNSRENFKSLIDNWFKIVGFKYLNIIFINPFSSLDKKWIVFPHIHHKICDEDSLEMGLNSMFEMVEPIDEKTLLAKITG